MKPTLLYAGLSVLALAANLRWKFDTDAGGYVEKFYPAKQAKHFAAALALAFVACWIGVPVWWAVGITIADGVLFEVTQGSMNPHDIAADILGAFAGVGLWRLL